MSQNIIHITHQYSMGQLKQNVSVTEKISCFILKLLKKITLTSLPQNTAQQYSS